MPCEFDFLQDDDDAFFAKIGTQAERRYKTDYMRRPSNVTGSQDTDGTDHRRQVEGITPNAILEKSVEETSKGNWSIGNENASFILHDRVAHPQQITGCSELIQEPPKETLNL